VLAAIAAAVGAGAVVGLAPRSGGPTALASGPGTTAVARPTSSGSLTARPSTSAHPSKSRRRTWPAKPKPSVRSSSPKSSAAAPTPTPQSSAPAPTERTITGPVVSNGWGPIQVTVTVKGTQLTAVGVPVIPQDGRSQFINSRAVPILTQEALQAQSAQVDSVSGATDTSYAFMQSLAAALQQAG
jgi:uncharacterized protein with FMN-binding domain